MNDNPYILSANSLDDLHCMRGLTGLERDLLHDLEVANGELAEEKEQRRLMGYEANNLRMLAGNLQRELAAAQVRIEELEQAVITLNSFDAPAEVQKLRAELAAAQATIEELQQIVDDNVEAISKYYDLQVKCEKIPVLMAEAEAHRTLLIERDETIQCLRDSVAELQFDIDNGLCDIRLTTEAQAFTIAQQSSVIAAMRRALENLHTLAIFDTTAEPEVAAACACAEKMLANTAQLAAAHDARIRADERQMFDMAWLNEKIADALRQAENACEGQQFHFDPQDIILLSHMLAYALTEEMNR